MGGGKVENLVYISCSLNYSKSLTEDYCWEAQMLIYTMEKRSWSMRETNAVFQFKNNAALKKMIQSLLNLYPLIQYNMSKLYSLIIIIHFSFQNRMYQCCFKENVNTHFPTVRKLKGLKTKFPIKLTQRAHKKNFADNSKFKHGLNYSNYS